MLYIENREKMSKEDLVIAERKAFDMYNISNIAGKEIYDFYDSIDFLEFEKDFYTIVIPGYEYDRIYLKFVKQVLSNNSELAIFFSNDTMHRFYNVDTFLREYLKKWVEMEYCKNLIIEHKEDFNFS